jgi:uncharacterized coiled-coil protein SlyX
MPGEGQEPPVDRQDRTVSVAEAARRLGKSPDAIRSALRRKALEGYRDNQGDWRIPADSLPTTDGGHDAIGGRVVDALRQELDRLHEELRQARDAAEAARCLSDDRQATVADLRERLGRVEGAVAAKDDLIAELKAMLAEARRPWWRRWIGDRQ